MPDTRLAVTDTHDGPRLFSVQEAADRLSLSKWILYKHIHFGTVSVTRCGARRLFQREELERICRDGLPSLPTTKKKLAA